MRPKILRQFPWFLKKHHLKNNSEWIDFYLVVLPNVDDENPWNNDWTFTVYASMHLPEHTMQYLLWESWFWYPVTIPTGKRKWQTATFDSREEAKRFEDYLIGDGKFSLIPEEFKHIHSEHINVMDWAFWVWIPLNYIPIPIWNCMHNNLFFINK